MAAGTAVVVGAGIGGLGAAVALRRRGWDVTVLERRSHLSGGVALSLWPNALRALERLGVDARDLRNGAPLGGQGGVRRPDGRWLARTDLGGVISERFGRPLVLLRRADLVAALVGHIPAECLRLGVTVTSVEPGDDATRAVVTDGTGAEHGADLVVVADGVHSGVRRMLFPEHPGSRYAGYTSWRMIADLPPDAGAGAETWGRRGERFAVLPLGDGRCYCYATAALPPGTPFEDEAGELRRRFGRWHDPIPAILASVGPDDVLRGDIEELAEPLPAMHAGRVAMLGDSAHAMTPELGQGGCQAIEDAVVLASVVGDAGERSPAVTLPAYTAARLARTADVTRRSRRAGLPHRGPAPVARLAARLMGAVPARSVVRGLAPVVDWRPPAA